MKKPSLAVYGFEKSSFQIRGKIYPSVSLLLFMAMISGPLHAQTYVHVKTDTVQVVNGELLVGNQSKDTLGVLTNTGNGVTVFKKLRLAIVGDSQIAIIGQDTINWKNPNASAGTYYVLSENIPVSPNNYYFPTAFNLPLDSGKLYQIHAVISLSTAQQFAGTSIRAIYLDTVQDDEMGIYNRGIDTLNHTNNYFLIYDKLVGPMTGKDTVRLGIKTDINDHSGTMYLDSLSYVLTIPVLSKVASSGYTVDTPATPPLQQTQFFINDSAAINFTPVAQNIPGWTDLAGDPHNNVLTATTENGWHISTVSTSLWNPFPDSARSAFMGGERDPLINDFGGFYDQDSLMIRSVFATDKAQFNGTNWNLELSGLSPQEQYIIRIIASTDDAGNYGSMRQVDWVSNYGHDSIYKALNAFNNTSWFMQFDTVHPDPSGKIQIMVGGVDSTYSTPNWRVGFISGLQIWQVSKGLASPDRIALQQFKDSGVISLSDGFANRKALVYLPQVSYDPTKRYPVIFYLAGNESSGADINIVRQYGLARLEELGHDLFGIKSDGDTIRFIVVCPQFHDGETGFSPLQLHNLLSNLKTSYYGMLPIDTTTTYATGFSYGGSDAADWSFLYPTDLKAEVALSPYASDLSDAQIGGLAHGFKDNHSYLMILTHSDQSAGLSKEYWDSVNTYSPGYVGIDQWFGRRHDGFNYQMDTAYHIPLTSQTIFDFMVNPTKNLTSASRFQFIANDYGGIWKDNYTTVVEGNPADSVCQGVDENTGVSVSTLSNGSWGGTSGGLSQTDIYGTSFGYYVLNNCFFTSSGTFASSGPNIQITGLEPNTGYEIIFCGSVSAGHLPPRVSKFGIDGSNWINILCNSNIRNYGLVTATSDATGKILCYVYNAPDVGGSSIYGILNGLIIRKR